MKTLNHIVLVMLVAISSFTRADCDSEFSPFYETLSERGAGSTQLESANFSIAPRVDIRVKYVEGMSAQELNAQFQRLRFYFAQPYSNSKWETEKRTKANKPPGVAIPRLDVRLDEPSYESVKDSPSQLSCSPKNARRWLKQLKGYSETAEVLQSGSDYAIYGSAFGLGDDLAIQMRLEPGVSRSKQASKRWRVEISSRANESAIFLDNPFKTVLLPPLVVRRQDLDCKMRSFREVRVYSAVSESELGCFDDDDLFDFQVLTNSRTSVGYKVRLAEQDLFWDIYGQGFGHPQPTVIGELRLPEVSRAELAFVDIVRAFTLLDFGLAAEAEVVYKSIPKEFTKPSTTYEFKLLSVYVRGMGGEDISNQLSELINVNAKRPELYRIRVMERLSLLRYEGVTDLRFRKAALATIRMIQRQSPYDDSWIKALYSRISTGR